MNATRTFPVEDSEKKPHSAGMHHRVLAYLFLNAIQLYFFFIYRVSRLRVRHRERLPELAPGDLYACAPHQAQATDGAIVGQLWFPASLNPRMFAKLPWILATTKHLDSTWHPLVELFHCIPVAQHDAGTAAGEGGNSREHLLSLKAKLATGAILYFPGGTRSHNLDDSLVGDSAAGALARVREVRRIIPVGIFNPVQPFRRNASMPSLTLPRGVDQFLRRAASWPRVGKIARFMIQWDWALGMRLGQKPVLTIGFPLTPEELRARVMTLKSQREARGEKVSLNQCVADFLVQESSRLNEEE